MPVTPTEFGIQGFAFPVVSGGGSCDYPDEGDVRLGVDYGSGAYTGTLAVAESLDPSLPLLHSPADIVRWAVIGLGYASDPTDDPLGAWPAYTGAEPSLPDDCVTTYDTTGRDGGRIMPSGERDEHPGVQVRVRSDNFPDGYAKAAAIARALDEDVINRAVSVDGTVYILVNVTRVGNVLSIGREPTSGRELFTVNLIVTVLRAGED